jgi:enoyl-CoA hydratase/carnithine racemase
MPMNDSPCLEVSADGYVRTVLLNQPPHNFVNVASMAALADTLHAFDEDADCRAIVLGSVGKNFCAGADFSGVPGTGAMVDAEALYTQAMRLFRTRKPIVAAIQGAAIGAGAGLALVADFRVACNASRFSVNFNRLGFHPGFGLSCTLPRLVGQQQAARLFYLGERLDGERMVALGLADELVPDAEVLSRAQGLARDIALSAPQAVQSTRETLRLGLADEVAICNAREAAIQRPQFASQDFLEGVKAAGERRSPLFTGH